MTTDDAADDDDAAAAANSDGTQSIITAGGGDDKGNDNNTRPTTGPRRTPGAAALLPAVSGADIEQGGAAKSSAITAVSSVISSTAKNILREFFERVDWPLNIGLPRGAEFFSGPLGDIVKQHCLEKAQDLRQLLNYKRGKYTQVSILLNPPDLDETLRKGIRCTTLFVTSILRGIVGIRFRSWQTVRRLGQRLLMLLHMQKRIRRWRILSVRHFGRMQQRMYFEFSEKE